MGVGRVNMPEAIELLAVDDPRPLKAKTCAVCKGQFRPFLTLQQVCGIQCARRVPIVARKAAQADRKATRARIEALRPLSYWVKQAQVAFNSFIRARDSGLACVSCGRHHAGKINAGHFLSTGARPELRFDEQNVWAQCEPCNTHLAGNLVLYRAELVRRIGTAAVERLEGPHPAKKYTRDNLKAIRDAYRARAKALRKD
jgi:Bacteriophage Lambda NinG protein